MLSRRKAEGPDEAFSFEGPFGKWDHQQLQRGYQVYKEVCAACHSIQYVAFRNLEELGYNEAEIKQEASTYHHPGLRRSPGRSRNATRSCDRPVPRCSVLRVRASRLTFR